MGAESWTETGWAVGNDLSVVLRLTGGGGGGGFGGGFSVVWELLCDLLSEGGRVSVEEGLRSTG